MYVGWGCNGMDRGDKIDPVNNVYMIMYSVMDIAKLNLYFQRLYDYVYFICFLG